MSSNPATKTIGASIQHFFIFIPLTVIRIVCVATCTQLRFLVCVQIELMRRERSVALAEINLPQ
jgi:hypothetical protein